MKYIYLRRLLEARVCWKRNSEEAKEDDGILQIWGTHNVQLGCLNPGTIYQKNAHVHVHTCVCVCEREREWEREEIHWKRWKQTKHVSLLPEKTTSSTSWYERLKNEKQGFHWIQSLKKKKSLSVILASFTFKHQPGTNIASLCKNFVIPDL